MSDLAITVLVISFICSVLALVHTMLGLPMFGMARRCGEWRIGPYLTEWRCVRDWHHEGQHIYEPDIWFGGKCSEDFRRSWHRTEEGP